MWICVGFIILFGLDSITASNEQSELNALTWPTDVAYDEPVARQLSSFESFLNGGYREQANNNKARTGDSSLSSVGNSNDSGQEVQSTSSGQSSDQNKARNLALAGRPLEYRPTLQTIKPQPGQKAYPLKQFLPGYANAGKNYPQVPLRDPIGVSWSRNKGYANNKVYLAGGPKVYVTTGSTYYKQPKQQLAGVNYYRPNVITYKGVTRQPIGYVTYGPTSTQTANTVLYVPQVNNHYNSNNNKVEYSELDVEDDYQHGNDNDDHEEEEEEEDAPENSKEELVEHLVDAKVDKIKKVTDFKADKVNKITDLKAEKLDTIADLKADKFKTITGLKVDKLDTIAGSKADKLEKEDDLSGNKLQKVLSIKQSKLAPVESSSVGKSADLSISSSGTESRSSGTSVKTTLVPMAGQPQKGFDPFINTKDESGKFSKNFKIQSKPGTERLNLNLLIKDKATSATSTKSQKVTSDSDSRGSNEGLAGAIEGAFDGPEEESLNENIDVDAAGSSDGHSSNSFAQSSQAVSTKSASQSNDGSTTKSGKKGSDGGLSSGSVKISVGDKSISKNLASLDMPIISRSMKGKN